MTMTYLTMTANVAPNSPAAFVLRHGRAWEAGANTFKGRRRKAKMCYMNAAKLAMMNPDLTYVEGYAIGNGIGLPLQHAWVVDKNGTIIDPTWKTGTDYFGVAFNTAYVRRVANETKYWGVISWLNPGLADTPPDEFLAHGERKAA